MSIDRQDIVSTDNFLDHPGTVVLGVSTTLLFVVAIVVGAFRRRARARLLRSAHARFKARSPVRFVEGPAILAGTVDAERPDLPAVIVETPPRRPADPRSEGPSRLDGIQALPLVRPFMLSVNRTKKRIFVVPEADVEVWGRRQLAERRDPNGSWISDVEVATVSPGERVIVRGRLCRVPLREQDGSYHGRRRGFVLRGAPGQRLLIDVESSVAEMDAAAPEVSEWKAIGIAALTYIPALGSYLRELALSKTRRVKVIEQSQGTSSGGEGLALADGFGCLIDANGKESNSSELSSCIAWRYATSREPSPLAPGDRVIVTVVPGWPDRAQLGRPLLPTAHLVQIGCWPALCFLLIFFVLVSVLNYLRPWSVWYHSHVYSWFTYRRRK